MFLLYSLFSAQIPKPVVKPAPIMNNLPSQGIPREEQQNVTRVMNYINEPPATSRPSLSPPGVSETVELSQYSFQNRERFVHVNDKDRISAAQVTPTPIPSKPAEDDDMKGALLPPKMPGWHGATIYSNLPEAVQQEFDLIMRESYYVKKESIDKENSEYNDEDSPVRRRGPGRLEAIERNKNNEASKRSRQRKKYLNQVLQNSLNYDLDENYLLYKQEKWLISIIKNLEVKFLHKASQNRGIIKAMRRECGFEE